MIFITYICVQGRRLLYYCYLCPCLCHLTARCNIYTSVHWARHIPYTLECTCSPPWPWSTSCPVDFGDLAAITHHLNLNVYYLVSLCKTVPVTQCTQINHDPHGSHFSLIDHCRRIRALITYDINSLSDNPNPPYSYRY